MRGRQVPRSRPVVPGRPKVFRVPGSLVKDGIRHPFRGNGVSSRSEPGQLSVPSGSGGPGIGLTVLFP
eukprot:777711-Heterocapsa_arctica.AAC.1